MGTQKKDVTKCSWAEVTDWAHAWDMADAVTYEDDGLLWNKWPATRVELVKDRGTNNVPLRRDKGEWGRRLCTRGATPGPIWMPSCKRFNGRPAICEDFLQPDGPWERATAGLFTCDNPHDESLWFNAPHGYPQPYLAAILCRPVNGIPFFGAWDASNGHIGTTVTIGHHDHPTKKKQVWAVTTSILIGDPWPTTDIEGDDNQTSLVLVRADGENSFLELNWRNADDQIETHRMNFELARRTAKEIFFGYVHAAYLTVAGMKLGAPTEEEIDRIRDWSAQYMPKPEELPLEPHLG